MGFEIILKVLNYHQPPLKTLGGFGAKTVTAITLYPRDHQFSFRYEITVGYDFIKIWWLLKEPLFCFPGSSNTPGSARKPFRLSSQSSWAEEQPECSEEHLPGRW